MRSYRIYQIDSFTTEVLRGNPAGVVPQADGLCEAEMQAIARELNNSETAFVLSPTAPDHEVWVRFFTPRAEVPICGHATVAAHFVRARELGLAACTVRQRTGAGVLPVEIQPVGDDYRIVMTQGAITFDNPGSPELQAEILAALGIAPGDADPRCPMEIVSTGHSKVLVGIRSRAKLNALAPDMGRLAGLAGRVGSNGTFVFTLDSDEPEVLVHGRMFAPAIGVSEDPVTGNANGPLGAYLVRHRLVEVTGPTLRFTARQGEAMGRPGQIDVEVDIEGGEPRTVRIAGRAVVAFTTELRL